MIKVWLIYSIEWISGDGDGGRVLNVVEFRRPWLDSVIPNRGDTISFGNEEILDHKIQKRILLIDKGNCIKEIELRWRERQTDPVTVDALPFWRSDGWLLDYADTWKHDMEDHEQPRGE